MRDGVESVRPRGTCDRPPSIVTWNDDGADQMFGLEIGMGIVDAGVDDGDDLCRGAERHVPCRPAWMSAPATPGQPLFTDWPVFEDPTVAGRSARWDRPTCE